MIEDVLSKVIANPRNYTVSVDEAEVIVYDKSNGDTHRFGGLPEYVLVELLNTMGAEAEHV